jgi:hypothetical protein
MLQLFSCRPASALGTCALALVALTNAAMAQAARIPVSVIEGRLVVRCDVSTRFRRLPANLFIDFEDTCSLQLHNQAAAGLKSETQDGRSFPITAHLPGLDMTVDRRQIGDDEYLDDFTRWNSIALGEVSVVGTIGAALLKDYFTTFDLDGGFIELAPPREKEETPVDPPEGVLRVTTTETNNIVWLPVSYDKGTPGAMVLGTGTYDTQVDGFLAGDLGFPAGDIGSVHMSGIDLTQFVVLRPGEVNYTHTDGALGVTGLNLLEHFRVEIDRVNHCAYFEQMRPAKVPEGDFQYFSAMVDEEVDGLTAFIETFKNHRLKLEASRLLLNLLLIEGADAEAIQAAVSHVDSACPEDLRATSALGMMKTCNSFGFPQYVILAGEAGLVHGRDDRYPDAVHKIHARLGEVHMDLEHGESAWRHLLSAAFGMPEDGMVNLNLGRFYESQGRHRRAFSRFLQAAIRPDSGPQGVEGLSRVGAQIPDGEGYSVDVVERMIAGKVRSFGAANRFEATEENSSNRIPLVEFFTNSFLGNGSKGAIGGALGNEGLTSHFDSGQVAFLSYHLPHEQLDPLINELGTFTAQLLEVPGPWMHMVDGYRQGPGSGRWSDAEGIYNEVRKIVLSRLKKEAEFDLGLNATVIDGVVKGELVVHGEARKRTQVQIVLAEKGVLFPGKTEVIVHRYLARAALTKSVAGIDWNPVDGQMTIPFEVSLDDIRAENERYIDELCAETGGLVRKLSMTIEPAQVRFIAHLRDRSTGRVLQAITAEPSNLAELEDTNE